MLGLESQLLWGPSLENIVELSYPRVLDSRRHWRRPAPGSIRERTPGGAVSSWVTARDYCMAGRARWFSSPLWSGGPGLQEFLDWAGAGNAFRFVPDKNVPLFYVDNCVLDEPFENPEPGLEQADGSQAIDLVIRNPSVDFGQALRGIMFEYAPGASLTDPVAATFTRATAATRRGLPGNLASAVGASDASGVLRDRHYEGSVRTTLLEAARTQLVTDPENFGAWGQAGTPIRTSGQADPFGGTAAYIVEDNDAAAFEHLISTGDIAFTDGERAFSLFVKQGTATASWFRIRGAAERHRVLITWTAGVPVLSTGNGAGTLFPVENWGNGWWRVSATAAGVVGADTNVFEFGPGTFVASAVGTGLFFGANAWDASFPSSYQGPSLGTRNADQFSWPHLYAPQAGFFYFSFVNLGSIALAVRLAEIGSGASLDPRSIFRFSSSSAVFDYENFGESESSVSLAAAVHGDGIEILGLLADAAGNTFTAQVKRSINGGAEIAGGVGAAVARAAAWSAATAWLNSVGSTSVGFVGLRQYKSGPLVFGGVTRDTIAKAVAA